MFEEFLENGDRVKFTKGWWRSRKYEKELMKLRGTVVGYDETSRHSIYYEVVWDGTESEIDAIGHTVGVVKRDSYQSEALTKVRTRKKKKQK